MVDFSLTLPPGFRIDGGDLEGNDGSAGGPVAGPSYQ